MEQISAALKELESVSGKLDPAEIVKFAADHPDSPLFAWFTWDDTEAAKRYRLTQARELIRTVKITVTILDHKVSAPGYVRDPEATGDAGIYRSIHHVKTDKEIARDVMVEEMKRVSNAISRANQIAHFLEAEDEIREIQRLVAALARRIGIDGIPPSPAQH